MAEERVLKEGPAGRQKAEKCAKCGKAIAGSVSGFPFQAGGCQCQPEPAFAGGKMSARFAQLRESGSGSVFAPPVEGAAAGSENYIDLLPGAIIGGAYTIIRLIGRGGMGEVYLVKHGALNRQCALKVIPPEEVTENAWLRFQQEARIVSRLEHVNLVRVTDLGIHEKCLPYYAMDYVGGQTLADILAAGGPMPLEDVLQIFMQVCDGAESAHHGGVLHRDLKPANIMVNTLPGGALEVKILDFGLAKLTGHDREKQSLTVVGDIFGSPFYMSPEQCSGEKLDPRSDIYSLGCTMFECLTGRPPFQGNLAAAVIFGHLSGDPPTLASAVGPGKFSDQMEIVMARLLRKNPQERYQTMQELRADLRRLLEGKNVLPLPVNVTGNQAAKPVAFNQPGSGSNIEQPERKTPGRNLLLAGCAAIVIMLVAFVLLSRTHASRPKSARRTDKIEAVTIADLPGGRSKTAEELKESFNPHIAHFNKMPDATADQNRLFEFPKDCSLGSLTINTVSPDGSALISVRKCLARGLIGVPARSRLGLNAGSALSLRPELFDGFGPYDLINLSLDRGCDWGDLHMPWICKLTGLKKLTVAGATLTDESIDNINRLTQLTSFCADNTEMTAAGLARLKRLPYLHYLVLPPLTGALPVLKVLKNCQTMDNLRIRECHLNDQDISYISTISNLVSLDISENTLLTDKCLPQIARLKHLTHLDFRGTRINPAAILSQKDLHLEWILFDGKRLQKGDLERLKKAVPSCNVAEPRMEESRDMLNDFGVGR